MDAEVLRTWLAIGQIGMSALVALALWGFATGRWTQKREGESDAVAKAVGTNAREISNLTVALAEKADCDRVSALEKRTEAEHKRVTDLGEKTHDAITRLALEQRGQQERVRVMEDTVKELRQKAFNHGGMAGV